MSLVKAQQYEEELKGYENDIREGIIKLRRLKGNDMDRKRGEIEEFFEKSRRNLKKITSLMKTEQNISIKDQMTTIRDSHKQEFKKLRAQLDNIIQQTENRDSVGVNVQETVETIKVEKKKPEEEELNDQLAEQLFGPVFETQKDCLAIIDRLNMKAEETLELGAESAELLRQQREQLIIIDKKMDELGSNTKRAGKELSAFFRKLATDKLIIVVCLLIGLAVIVAVVVKIVYHVVGPEIKKQQQTK
ncbi:1 TM domain-containing transmembrane protein [Acrasis kona]|uniref:1 TM domain-containing transmembrane protein n=1 Tax=Acrasis kona TaxID=1008807 RepID=A0AAW2Z8R0_9EUKA